MSAYHTNSYNPYEDINTFYRSDDPSEEEQFRFVEAMKFFIETEEDPAEKIVSVFNLAIYYRDIKEFVLEKKYMEMGAELGNEFCKEKLGFIWYYGLCGEQDYEKAFRYFNECKTIDSLCMISDMYRLGQYVNKDPDKGSRIIENMFMRMYPDRHDSRFFISSRFPEVALRFAQICYEGGMADEFDLEYLNDARSILAVRQQNSPFWGNIKTMHSIIECIEEISGGGHECNDIYDLLTLDTRKCSVTFDYNRSQNRIDLFTDQGETVYI